MEKFDKLYLSAKGQQEKYGKSDMDEIDAKLETFLERYELESTISAYNKVNYLLKIPCFFLWCRGGVREEGGGEGKE